MVIIFISRKTKESELNTNKREDEFLKHIGKGKIGLEQEKKISNSENHKGATRMKKKNNNVSETSNHYS